MKRFKQEKGITLIALIVTIIVLIILALISMNAIFGEDGIINRAEKAKEEYEKGRALEEMKLELLGMRMDEILTGENSSELIEKLGIKGIEKIEIENNEETYYYITEKDGAYYRTVMKNNSVLSMEKVDALREEAEAMVASFEEEVVTWIGNALQFIYKNTLYNVCEDVVDNTTVLYVEKILPIKMIVNSGEDGIVELPVDGYVTSVDWGDGNIETAPSHEYAEKNKEYEVTINGAIWKIDSGLISEVYDNKIIEITQWGTTGLEEVYLSGCTNLRKIASPNEDSFVDTEVLNYAFRGCTSLAEIPSDLFSNCPNVTSFINTFEGCTSLTEIPSDLFANCPNVTDFDATFLRCTSLTGNAPELWTLGTNSESNSYMGEPDGNGCFAECTGLTNYENIPDYWKTIVYES